MTLTFDDSHNLKPEHVKVSLYLAMTMMDQSLNPFCAHVPRTKPGIRVIVTQLWAALSIKSHLTTVD